MKLLLAATFLTAATSASAATLFSLPAATPEFPSPGAVSYNFVAAGGAGSANFEIAGYASLDGVNCCTDTFTLSLNGTTVFSGSFALGGGGANVVYTAAPGTSYTATQSGFFQGGKLDVTTPLTLAAGTNTLSFAYSGVAQGLGDEGWGVNSAIVTGAIVPEPAAWSLLVVGFGLIGVTARRRAVKTVMA